MKERLRHIDAELTLIRQPGRLLGGMTRSAFEPCFLQRGTGLNCEAHTSTQGTSPQQAPSVLDGHEPPDAGGEHDAPAALERYARGTSPAILQLLDNEPPKIDARNALLCYALVSQLRMNLTTASLQKPSGARLEGRNRKTSLRPRQLNRNRPTITAEAAESISPTS